MTKEQRKARLAEYYKTAAAAQKRLDEASARYTEVDDKIMELEGEMDSLESECHLLEELIPELEAAENTPEAIEHREYMAAINNPNQMRLTF